MSEYIGGEAGRIKGEQLLARMGGEGGAERISRGVMAVAAGHSLLKRYFPHLEGRPDLLDIHVAGLKTEITSVASYKWLNFKKLAGQHVPKIDSKDPILRRRPTQEALGLVAGTIVAQTELEADAETAKELEAAYGLQATYIDLAVTQGIDSGVPSLDLPAQPPQAV